MKRINYLLNQYLSDQSSDEELMELREIIRKEEQADVVNTLTTFIEETKEPEWKAERLQEMVDEVLRFDKQQAVIKVIPLWKKLAVAASFIAALSFGAYMLLKDNNSALTTGPELVEGLTRDVPAPDKNRAQIKLSDGTIIYLDSAVNGELATVDGVKLTKTADGQVAYSGSLTTDHSPLTAGASPLTNTLTNPRGSKVIDMTLSDGSRVWLNAGSSVTYPVAFIGNERKVSITGEAYFEIAHNANKPFFVTNGDVQVKVLGTHFNVNAYEDDDAVRVTLLEGSVRVSRTDLPPASAGGIMIKPGEQAISNEHSPLPDGASAKAGLTIDHSPDMEQVMAWKNGSFVFGEAMSAEEIMRQISRWYDVEVIYEKKPTGHIGGSISRTVNITKVLQILEATGTMKFRVEGKKVIMY